jgi:hypothetical protein
MTVANSLSSTYADKITADGVQGEERRLCGAIESARARATDEQHEERAKSAPRAILGFVLSRWSHPQGPPHRGRLKNR